MAKKQNTDGANTEGNGDMVAGGKKITKTEAVRRAIAAGVSKPTEGVDFIRREFGLDLKPQHFSTYKTQIQKQQGKKPRHKAKAKGTAPVTASRTSEATSNPLEAARQVKDLVDHLGPETVRGLVDLFAP